MKKLILLIVAIAFAASYAQAQKLNQDTVAKYSKKTEQVKVFDKVAADIHLNAAQSTKFTLVSTTYADKAIAVVKDTKSNRCDKIQALRQTLKDYSVEIKKILSPQQFAMLKGEREKYQFGRRFVICND